MIEFGKALAARTTPIPGLVLWDLPVHGDARGWFKENWQRHTMVQAGLPDFGPVQNNVSFNDAVGTTRGIHAEPWDKWISIATGKVFAAWVDLREGATFGAVFTAELDPSTAVFVPRGVGNSYQTLEPDTAYVYLVNDHWSPEAQYTFLNLADETVAVPWPVPLDKAEVSDKDRTHPRLAGVVPMAARRTLVLGAAGQLGRALRARLTGGSIEFASRDDLDVTASGLDGARPWRQYDVIINAAAYTAVDAAESPDGRRAAWRANAQGGAALARVATDNGITLVHFSSDYVFDGSGTVEYGEEADLSPLGVYAQTKAAGDLAVMTTPRHYILRTSWVIGDGANFVRTMDGLAGRGVDPRVVDDQRGRPTFSADLADAVAFLLRNRPPYGIYNVTSEGPIVSWFDLAREVFRLGGHDPGRVTPVSTAAYIEHAAQPVAPRPAFSGLDLAKITAAGWRPPDWRVRLAEYLTD